MVKLIGAVREALGPCIDLAVDCHWNYNTRDAITLARELEPFHLMWLEDPVPPDDLEALKRVTDHSPVPICSGENQYTRHGVRPMITTQAVDIVQPDIAKAGGLLEQRKSPIWLTSTTSRWPPTMFPAQSPPWPSATLAPACGTFWSSNSTPRMSLGGTIWWSGKDHSPGKGRSSCRKSPGWGSSWTRRRRRATRSSRGAVPSTSARTARSPGSSGRHRLRREPHVTGGGAPPVLRWRAVAGSVSQVVSSIVEEW